MQGCTVTHQGVPQTIHLPKAMVLEVLPKSQVLLVLSFINFEVADGALFPVPFSIG